MTMSTANCAVVTSAAAILTRSAANFSRWALRWSRKYTLGSPVVIPRS